jgi:hypothetical protein
MSSPFRAAAVDRYMAGRAEVHVPSVAVPRVSTGVYVLMVLLSGLILFAAIGQMPVYASGTAVIVHGRPGAPDGIFAAALLPAETLSHLKTGQAIHLEWGNEGERLRSTTVAVEPEIISPDRLSSRIPLGEMGTRVVFVLNGPVAVVFAPLDPSTGESYLGSVVQANVEIATRPLLALVPPFDRWLGTD